MNAALNNETVPEVLLKKNCIALGVTFEKTDYYKKKVPALGLKGLAMISCNPLQ